MGWESSLLFNTSHVKDLTNRIHTCTFIIHCSWSTKLEPSCPLRDEISVNERYVCVLKDVK